MPKTIEAIYENGVFKPLEKVVLKEHEKIQITIESEQASAQPDGCTLAGIIDIARDCADTDLSIHHDKYLYGEVTA